ncbi:hypothetical protein FACS1894190_03950 [Spirochaetia bacterium]|nr:hypothetical protein FACS1894190_03950 [Spirochaetia bacterium]
MSGEIITLERYTKCEYTPAGSNRSEDVVFNPLKLIIEEGISTNYEGRLTVWTDKVCKQDKLKELLDTSISISITQEIDGAEFFTDVPTQKRFFHGIITHVKSSGPIVVTNSISYFLYEIIIESVLAPLKYTRKTKDYKATLPNKIIESILTYYNINADFTFFTSKETPITILGQFDCSDYSFIQSLLSMYGISFAWTHPDINDENSQIAGLLFNNGSSFPAPILTYTGDIEGPLDDVYEFDCLASTYDREEETSVWKMDAWTMENSIGVDRMELTSFYPIGNKALKTWIADRSEATKTRFFQYARMFHGYLPNATTEKIDADIKAILDTRKVITDGQKIKWKGQTSNLCIIPGANFRLKNYYGADDDNLISGLVTKSTLTANAPWPTSTLGSPPGGINGAASVLINFSAVDWGNESNKRYCAM